VLDLSPAGHQPMVSASERYVIAFNGEIYNHGHVRALVSECANVERKTSVADADRTAGIGTQGWRGNSDTETLLAAIEAWGLERALSEAVGMFAFALWDRSRRTLHLVRDRMGEKPLYFGWIGGDFVFASELGALKKHPRWDNRIAAHALELYFKYNYVPSPHSIFEGIYKLDPGAVLSLNETELGRLWSFEDIVSRIRRFWSLRSILEEGERRPFRGSDDEAAEELDVLLRESVGGQMLSDVPLGAFLSGGVDSTAVVAIMQSLSGRPVNTFTIGFTEAAFDEARDAARIARHLGTRHTELYVRPEDALDVIPRLPDLYSEPFADASQIPTYLVSRLARESVTVCLSGDGGDELFGGYNRHLWVPRLWQRMRRIPLSARRRIARLLGTVSPDRVERIANRLGGLFPGAVQMRLLGNKWQKLARVLPAEDPREIYRQLVSAWPRCSPTRLADSQRGHHECVSEPGLETADIARWLMYLDAVGYLPNDILVKLDRASMGVSLEARAPFLDHRIVEFAWRLPTSLKIRDGKGKWLLRQVLYRYVPEDLVERPKMGFGVPIDRWLRSELRDWCESLLSRERLERQEYLNADCIRRIWREHMQGSADWSSELWGVLMFQAWFARMH